MDVLHISAECYPAAKTGGLADVIGALPKYLAGQGVTAGAIIPKYDLPWISQRAFVTVFEGLPVSFALLGTGEAWLHQRLNQLYAMRCGTIPIVRAVGGLRDSSLLFQDQPVFQAIRQRITGIDNSWERAARDHIDIYEQSSTVAPSRRSLNHTHPSAHAQTD